MPLKRLNINIVGSHTIGMTGEKADEVHIADSFEKLGHKVTRVRRDVWKAVVDGETIQSDWVLPDKEADVSIVAKWHHFNKSKYASELPGKTLYWTWDWMQWPTVPEWHIRMLEGSDLHLTNDYNSVSDKFKNKSYYFPMDITDEYPIFRSKSTKDVVFFGSCFETGGRIDLLKEVHKNFNLEIYSQDFEKWKELGFNAYPPKWGQDLAKLISESKICLQISINNDIWGYWSNRVGKILSVQGFMLAKYVPGMEIFIGEAADYFNTIDEALEKIKFYLENENERKQVINNTKNISWKFTSLQRIKELEALIVCQIL